MKKHAKDELQADGQHGKPPRARLRRFRDTMESHPCPDHRRAFQLRTRAPWLIPFVLVLADCATSAPTVTTGPTATTLQSLEGRWKAIASTVHFSDGTTRTQNTTCWAEFSGNQSVTECRIAGLPTRTAHVNRELGSGRFEQTIIENLGAPNTVGMHGRIEFRIENGTLFTTGYPAPPNQAPRRYVVKIESTWVRDTAEVPKSP